jgi:hypothetical protein
MELLTTDAFAAWYSALPPAPAEDVAATIEVIVELGARDGASAQGAARSTPKEAPGSSDALLWYEHPLVSQRGGIDFAKHIPPELVRFTQEYGRFSGYVKRVTKHLGSKPFVARLARLSPEGAATVHGAVERIRRLAWQRPVAVSDYQLRKMRRSTAPSAADLAALERLVDTSEVREAYFAALATAGFDIEDVPPTPAALREITLRSTPPGLRILYGIDETKDRGLVVLGEWLDRSFYGDSVRKAEATWGDFLGGRPLTIQAAAPR